MSPPDHAHALRTPTGDTAPQPRCSDAAIFSFPNGRPMIDVAENFWHRAEIEGRLRTRRQKRYWIVAVAAHLALAALLFVTLSGHPEEKPEVAEIEMLAPPAPPPVEPPKPVEVKEPPKPHVVVQRVVPKPLAKLAPPPPLPAPVATLPPMPQEAPPPPPAPAHAGPPPTYISALYAHLEANKQYPRAAKLAHIEGTALLHFTMNRQGRVLSFKLDRSSGHEQLDAEVLAMIQRAQPLPAPPADLPDPLELTIPVKFSVR